ncbi:DUF218 domain-containing protein [Quadrisphaera granulorum]|uniref:DUF218 domain-containing protein n=1 Tax=Quadrisphaera granulorum TaxID=317664 RepID=A0A316A8G0_9ACTN|nr:YdcF family protein [Quadrisphaera granulorum]PWJ53792.1 DUF218 domain-containing protein [Quadrisphaera granulorum]SZE96549.1 DUF218 domain-containing protein [Quadrisphaera granulorum]
MLRRDPARATGWLAGRSWSRRLQLASASVAVMVLLWPVVDIAVNTAWSHRRVDANHLDAVVVLGSSLDAGQVTPLLESRARRAADLVAQARHDGGDPWVVTSGGVTGPTPADGQPVSEARALGDRLIALGVEPRRLLLEERALTTADNLAYALPLLTSTDPAVRRVAVVTSDGHVARVRLLLRQAISEHRVEDRYEVTFVGAWTPLQDVRAALLREMGLVAGQRADTAVTAAWLQSRRWSGTADPV